MDCDCVSWIEWCVDFCGCLFCICCDVVWLWVVELFVVVLFGCVGCVVFVVGVDCWVCVVGVVVR